MTAQGAQQSEGNRADVSDLPANATGSGEILDAGPLLPEGFYDLAFLGYQTARLFGKAEKLIIYFRVVSQGEGFGQRLARYYNVKVRGKPRVNGAFKASGRSDCAREFGTLFQLPSRLDRIPMSLFANVIIEGRVGTVRTGRTQREIPECLHYSVIRELLRVKRL